MYAAAQVKPKSFEAEHLGPAPISGPHLVATYKAGREIYAQGDLSDKCYQVSTGAVRVYRLLSDGRRQVVSFHLPGEMFGFEAGPNHSFFAEAITATTLAVFGRRHMQERSRELLALALTGMARAQQHLLVIGRQCAVERIAAFLVDLSERQGGGRQLRLPMSRQDIADYLGLTIETVSRVVTKLKERSVIVLRDARTIDIVRMDALRLLCN
ncbi:helix-turn-helix domain-containing protein [Sinorhizobium medicae]|uniref:Putative transcriptional regulator, Crp/Fnr family n=9 Tax=Sinorhizobium medicae TaxID=110321 RepID=A6UMI9_SINMW|nr:helix-turn-helix domain-containing protein [Sinorhizobium medicae]ABR64869.1 putative transcriptional regulator, Crp/Fnr family [Sinorhizobium medicae WSM419]MDX0405049.1 helix-turn-helix domain-containing protein [Sinorhizobium medicae]MDX0412043.1 helix-turn-helix domain-containing protein [Sinorhizobium medicae]MDX0416641.1 helix-turn-helix domain-containing protein [Sinorhizobium medicae]MDX0423986.1 helix-turn-helix domain-containing protein [Sinorhizobium medicae]